MPPLRKLRIVTNYRVSSIKYALALAFRELSIQDTLVYLVVHT